MKRLYAYIIVPLLFIGSFASAQEETGLSQMDSIVISNPFRIRAAQNAVKNADVFDKSPEVDIAKALYGQFSGLLVKQGTGRSEENQSKLRLHGHSPLIVIDGFPRDISDVTGVEIESVQILKDAASAALYGVRGGNGVVLITTKRGKATPLKVTAKYQYGMAKMFRAPEFADAYTYGYFMNQARELDGLAAKYTQNELYALYTGGYPYAYPNVNWWDQVYRSHGDNHRAQFTFNGGNRNFRYFAAIDYMKDDALYVKPTADDRYNAKVYDNRLGLRDPKVFAPLWIVDFPLLEWDDETQRFYAMHHPFTAPKPEHEKWFYSNKKEDLERVCANAYDFVLNGTELGGGSIRIHDAEMQKRMFEVLGISPEDAEYKFGFIIHAFQYGAPPHGGLAFGFDRVCALFGGSDSIRDYIAFPKNNQGRDVMIDSPSKIDQEQMDELQIASTVKE